MVALVVFHVMVIPAVVDSFASFAVVAIAIALRLLLPTPVPFKVLGVLLPGVVLLALAPVLTLSLTFILILGWCGEL